MTNIIEEIQSKYIFLDNLLTKCWKQWNNVNLTSKLELRSIKWKNVKAQPGCAYKPTKVEQFANVLTHGIWIVPAVIAALKLFERSTTNSQYMVSWVYGSALILLFSISTFFHCSCYTQHTSLRNFLHRCDRAMIYVFIASSYFPWLQLYNRNHSLVLFTLEWVIWVLATIGITYQQIYHERYKCLETCFYMVMGLGPALAILADDEFIVVTELKLGGIFYIVGIVFFKADGCIPMAHAIWHLFVVLAASFHYFAILENLYPNNLIELKAT